MLRERVPSTARPRLLFVGLGTGKMVTLIKLEAPHVLTDVIEYDGNMVKGAQVTLTLAVTLDPTLYPSHVP